MWYYTKKNDIFRSSEILINHILTEFMVDSDTQNCFQKYLTIKKVLKSHQHKKEAWRWRGFVDKYLTHFQQIYIFDTISYCISYPAVRANIILCLCSPFSSIKSLSVTVVNVCVNMLCLEISNPLRHR